MALAWFHGAPASDFVTYFVYATIGIYGFFTLLLFTDAKVFFGADSPMCYWTVFDVSAQWFAKATGLTNLAALLSPFYAGVDLKTFVQMMLPINIFYTYLFYVGAFGLTVTGPAGCSAPMMDMNMWIPQIGLGVTFTVWNFIALAGSFDNPIHNFMALIKGGSSVGLSSSSPAKTFCLAQAFVYAVTFGSTLMISPGFFWGPDSILCYWEVLDDAGSWFGQALGCAMVALFLAPLYAGLEFEKLAVIALPLNLLFLPMFAKAAFFMDATGPGANALLPINLWAPQVLIGLAFLVWNITVLKNGKGIPLY